MIPYSVGQNLNPIRTWLVTPVILVPILHPIDISVNADHCYSFQIHQFFISIFDFDVETFYSDVSSPQVACKTRSITMNILSSKETSRSIPAWFFLNFVTKVCSVFNNLVLHWQLRAVVRACTIWRVMGNKYPWLKTLKRYGPSNTRLEAYKTIDFLMDIFPNTLSASQPSLLPFSPLDFLIPFTF